MDDDAFKHIEAIIYSMTKPERENPALLNGSRRKRIADGSGTSIQEVKPIIETIYGNQENDEKWFRKEKNMQRMMSGLSQKRKF